MLYSERLIVSNTTFVLARVISTRETLAIEVFSRPRTAFHYDTWVGITICVTPVIGYVMFL